VAQLLVEIEQYEGLIIMATNRPYDLDEAMYRRINLAIEFLTPDFALREDIWKSHVPDVQVHPEVDWKALAMDYELTGGFIKNAMLAALSYAIARDGKNIQLRQADLEKGAKLQLRGHLQLIEFEKRVIPTRGLDKLVLPTKIKQQLAAIISFEKAKKVLFGHWGFDAKIGQGTVVVFFGPSGTGKSLGAEALGYETGRPLKEINCAEILSRYAGGTSKNIESIFEDAKSSDAIIVLGNAEFVFNRSIISSTRQHEVVQLLHHINKFSGLVILTTESIDDLDLSSFKYQQFQIEFKKPSQDLQYKLWSTLLPSKTPIHTDVNFNELVSKYDFTGGDILNAIVRAAENAALRSSKDKVVTMRDLLDAAQEEVKQIKHKLSTSYRSMFQ